MKKEVLEIIRELNIKIDDFYKNSYNISLFSGLGGVILYKVMIYKLLNEESYKKEVRNCIKKIFNIINEDEIYCNYSNGLIGIALLFDIIVDEKILNKNLSKNLEIAINEFDQIIIKEAIKSTKSINDVDFLHGSFGAALYLIERYNKNNRTIDNTDFLFFFEKLAEIISNDINTSLKFKKIKHIDSDDYHKTNCGLAHGYVSYILIFIKFIEKIPKNSTINKALTDSIYHLLSFESNLDETLASYPSIAINKNTAQYDVALGWCYGDQTISICLYKASILLNDENLMAKSKLLAYRNLKRSIENKNFPYKKYDSGFCHGLSSVAYLHKKWYKITNDQRFFDEYERIIDEILHFYKTHNGFPKLTANGSYKETIGLLDGSIGVGLILIDNLKNENSNLWDKFFLIDD